jgi:hypothetical protein
MIQIVFKAFRTKFLELVVPSRYRRDSYCLRGFFESVPVARPCHVLHQ